MSPPGRRRRSGHHRGWAAAAWGLSLLAGFAVALGSDGAPMAPKSWITLFQCVAAGDYRWTEVDAAGELRLQRANSLWLWITAGRRRLDGSARETLGSLATRLPDARITPPRENPELRVEPVVVVLRVGDLMAVFDERSEGGPWSELMETLRRLSSAPLEAEPRQGGLLAAVPLTALECLGEDAPRVDGGALPRFAAHLLMAAAASPVEPLPLTTDEVRRLYAGPFRRHNVVRWVTADGEEFAFLLVLPEGADAGASLR